MSIVNIHEAKTHLSRLIDAVARGETITIAKAGTPVAKLTRVDSPATHKRIGFLEGRAHVPDDFDTIAEAEIADLFEGGAD
ncbi:type II toxin-antitoxin system Phd/YefM family antitoxin [Microbacterium sp. NIBRBAC000506063]|uniref:type II toxin-antitoxin system Phd/YefM family antitoxin n=1 Tax=Microbacterium sp. NIBRBAC000506063 TaxID=2734618 RepID=UPI001BB66443|nr:type II toxin-antitoxin system prevent-host-death family antitoxin [Microbacterium sp. NIBRBAC000506063]QTV80095.1 type II toxin-antitoxin system Phd/YefM family antitoxin [Microbacterium sp. NIBRBAC000506063]